MASTRERLAAEIDQFELPAGYSIFWKGEAEAQKALFFPEISANGNRYWNNKKGLLLSIPQVWIAGALLYL